MKKVKSNVKGITLIALVVTIIVLLILASVAISLTIGSNGIFTRAGNAVDRYEIASADEQDELNKAVNFIDDYMNEKVTDGGDNKKVSDVVGGEKFEETETIKDDNEKEVTIPKGFGVAEDSNTVVDEGIIITDGTNEFVWVPVDDPSTMFEEKTATLTGVETQTTIYSKLRVREGESFTAGTPGTSGIREPDVLSNYDTITQIYQEILGLESTKEMADSFVSEYKAMSDSVKKYHGFYIGRYELTGTVDNPTVKAGKVLTAAKAASSEAGSWYGLYKACQNVIKNNTDVKSIMIYGCQWDETISWLRRKGYNTDTDSSSWGNYSGSPIDTGSDSRYKANEIFDLAGNYFDWTQEANSTSNRIVRGGYFSIPASSLPAANRGNDMVDFYGGGCYSARVTLYIS